MDKLEIAEQARAKVQGRETHFLCWAVMKVCGIDYPEIGNTLEELCRAEAIENYPEAAFVFERIAQRLEGHNTFESLHQAKGLPEDEQSLRAARVAFMDELIKEWGGEEDE